MKGSLTRLQGLALRPLWTEDALQRAHRRCRTLISTPFAALGGLTWGVFAAPAIGVGSPLFWGALGAFAFPFFMYVERKLVPGFSELARRLGFGTGAVAGLAWEAGVVSGLIYLLTRVLGAPIVPAVGTSLGIGAFYAIVMEYVLCGSAAADVATLIRGGGTATSARSDPLSHARTLSMRGEHDAAIAIYEEALERKPRDAAGYVQLARAHVATGAFDEAVDTLRRGFAKAKLTADQEAFVVRQIHEVCVSKLAEPTRALADLRLLLEHQPAGKHAEWARREVDDIEAGAYEEP